MFEAAKAVMRPEMVVGGWRLGSGGLEAEVVMFGGSACSMASQVVRLASQVVRLASQVVRLDKKGFSENVTPSLQMSVSRTKIRHLSLPPFPGWTP